TINSWPVGKPIRMLPQMRHITLRVILQAVMGLAPGPELDDLEGKVERVPPYGRPNPNSIEYLKSWRVNFLPNAPWVRFFGQVRALDEALFAFIGRRRWTNEAVRSECVVDDLLAARHEDGRPVDDQEIRDGIVTLLLAGFDTTSIALSWALEQIVPRADVLE